MLNYKNTLNLPYTEFSMQGNLASKEVNILKRWYKNDLYRTIRKSKKGRQLFLLHDGPPYVNDTIHLGHAVNKILKDIIIKVKGLMGYDAPYLPGWDCHGLPVELKVEQLVRKNTIGSVDTVYFRKMCRQYALEQVTLQKGDFIRLGVLGDWDNSYLTMNFITEANIIRTLGKIISHGHVYKGVKPLHWCIECKSVVADAEIDYRDHFSLAIHVLFKAVDVSSVARKFGVIDFSKDIFFVIWTTAPWTLPANRAIAVDPNADYQLIRIISIDRYFIVSANLVDSFIRCLSFSEWLVLGTIKGCMLEFLRFHHPFMEFNVPVILSNHVTLDNGTGSVHIAPGHGSDDYFLGKRYGLDIYNIVDMDGIFLPDILSDLKGVKVFDGNTIIVNLLRCCKSLLHVEQLMHSYPYCWRHNIPLIFRVTPQWFISMDKYGLRQRALEEIKLVKWIPSKGYENIRDMLMIRPDWCISRQRIWGVPMTLFIHKVTNTLHPRTVAIIEQIAQIVEKKGIQYWWDVDAEEIIGHEAADYIKVFDTLDVWFDSGSTNCSVFDERSEFFNRLSDMYLEGSDQYRGWFMSSLLISLAVRDKAPYSQVLTHGFTVDEKGLKMSKSLGNVIKPKNIINKLGSDVLRLWVASNDYKKEMSISDKILQRTSEVYRRIRNTFRFCLANLNGFDPEKDIVHCNSMLILDCWAVSCAYFVQLDIIKYYNDYSFHHVVQRIMHFCSVELGSFYLDVIKDRQYTNQSGSLACFSCQTALYHITEAMVRWISPIIPFTADEIWQFLPGKRSEYVFTEEWYTGLFSIDESNVMNNNYWNTLLKVRSAINKVIEKARFAKIIDGSLNASITLYAKLDLLNKLRALGDELCFLFIVSEVIIKDYFDDKNDLKESEDVQGLKILIRKADGVKCQRCWHYRKDIGLHFNYPDICNRCVNNIIGPGEIRRFI